MILGDLHIHSSFSDGKHTIPEIVDFYGKRGFGVIAITDHLCETNTFLGKAATYLNKTLTPATFPLYLEILKSEAERAWRLYKMVVIPGYEITKNSLSNHRSAHILGLGVDQFVSAEGEIVDICKNIRNQGALAVAAHPVPTRKIEKQTYHLWDRREELKKYLDAWEVASGPHFFDEVMKSGLPLLATSDLHSFSQINAWKTVFHCEKHPEAILEAIRKQKLSFRYYQEEVENELRHYLDLDRLRAVGDGNSGHDIRNWIVPKTLK
ncbi:MAG: PHP domain-containing protein [Bdellovibrionota bacterium]